MANFISEDDIEQALLQRLQHLCGYDALNCFTATPDDLNDGSGRSDKREVILAFLDHLTEFELADFRRVMDTNLVAVWVLCKAAAQQMIPRKQGRLILTGSISAMNARPTISAYLISLQPQPPESAALGMRASRPRHAAGE